MLYSLPETGKRLLHVLARNFGRPLTVQELSDQTKDLYGKGFYANTYRELQAMREANLIRWETKGRSAIIQLDPSSPTLADYLAQLEAWKRIKLFEERPDAAPTLDAIRSELLDRPGTEAAWLLDAARSIRLNRFLILLITDGPDVDHPRPLSRTDARIEAMANKPQAFLGHLAKPGDTPLRNLFTNAIPLLGGTRTWTRILLAARGGSPIWLAADPPRPTDDDITRSLAHYGYEEFGRTTTTGPVLPIETLAMELLRTEDARRRRALPAVLSKTEFDPNLLAFLARVEGLQKRLADAIGAKNTTAALKALRLRLTAKG